MSKGKCYIDCCPFTPLCYVLTNPDSVRSLVWTDYRVALLFAVFIPLTLLIWSWVKKSESVSALLIIYWRAASLLMITVYLMMASWPIAFVTSVLAKLIIPFSLWFWADLNEEIREQPKRSLNLGFNAWRWAMTAYCFVSGVIQLLFVRCGFSIGLFNTESCQAWLEPSLGLKSYIHSDSPGGFLGFMGACGLAIYALYLGYFLVVRLGRQGRSAINQ